MNSQDKKFKLIDTSFKMIEKSGWENFTFKKLAYKANVDINKITQLFKSKKKFIKRIF